MKLVGSVPTRFKVKSACAMEYFQQRRKEAKPARSSAHLSSWNKSAPLRYMLYWNAYF